MGDLQAVIFDLNNLKCGVDSSEVQEIVRYQEVFKVPDLPQYVEGIINLRGKVIPLINLNKRFNEGETPITNKTKIIISKVNDTDIGFVVDEVKEITVFKEGAYEPPSDVFKMTHNEYIKCVGVRDEKLILILSFSAILNESELLSLSSVR